MEYGCIGEHLKHSFSKEIHNALSDYEYEIKEVAKDALSTFAEAKEFKAINVTIPYKELIIPHLYEIDSHAREIGAVNTVVNRGGKLYGYNTDFYGMTELMRHAGINVKGKKVAILGSGGTAKTALAVCRAEGASQILKVSRSKRDDTVTYGELYSDHSDTEIIINTTPIGMFPDIFNCPLELERFAKLSGVIDAIYNPLRTPLILKAKELGIPAEGGLYMLVAQGVRASEIFTDVKYPTGKLDEVYCNILREKENVVLIGMPSSGKTTVGKILAKEMGRAFVDTDLTVSESCNMEISDVFTRYGEEYFRDRESEAVASAATLTSVIIATGGGTILRPENVSALKENGRIFFIDRPLERLIPTADRPLSSSADAVKQRYCERYELYKSSADHIIDADTIPQKVAERIREAIRL